MFSANLAAVGGLFYITILGNSPIALIHHLIFFTSFTIISDVTAFTLSLFEGGESKLDKQTDEDFIDTSPGSRDVCFE